MTLAVVWESFFRSAFERSRNPMMLVRGDRRHIDVNDAATDLLGYGREQLLSMRIDDLFPPPERARIATDWVQFLHRNDALTGEDELLCHDGSHVGVEYAAHTEVVTGRLLVLFVVLHADAADHADEPDAMWDQPLTPREREIVHLLAMGLSGPEIATELFVSHETVRTHVRNAMEKAHARTRAQLVAKALAHGVTTRV
jgi:PAS domain S-box-containing protein